MQKSVICFQFCMGDRLVDWCWIWDGKFLIQKLGIHNLQQQPEAKPTPKL